MKSKHILRIAGTWQNLSALIILIAFTISCTTGQPGFKAGAARVNITPPCGTIINGDFLPMYAQVIHDSLYSKALAFDNGHQRFVFVVVDNMTLDADLINDAKEIITKNTGLGPEQVMISCTHAHSCGSVIETATVQADLSYRLMMPGKIARSAVLALENLKPAKIAWGHTDVPKYVSCRRWYMKPGYPMISPFGDTDKVWMNPNPGDEHLDRPVSPVDPQVSYIAVKTLDDRWISILANYSTHYSGVPGNTISADYYGEMDVQLKSKLNAGDHFVGIMCNGTSGDVNTFDFRLNKKYPADNYEKIRMMADEISDSILVSLNGAKWSANPVLKSAFAEAVVARRQPTPEILSRSEDLVKNTDFNKLGTTDKASDDIARLYALDVVKIEAYQPVKYSLPVQAIRIGEGAIGTLPGEFFSETGLKLKKEAPVKYYFSVSLANAMIGYVPPAGQFLLGGYETWLCSGSLVEVNGEEKIRKTLTDLIRSVQ
jgi:neutral ceramidase